MILRERSSESLSARISGMTLITGISGDIIIDPIENLIKEGATHSA